MAVELSSTGEQEMNPPILAKSVRRILKRPDIDVFIPAVSSKVRSDSQVLVYMDGYVFVRYEDGIPYLKLRDTTYFRDVLRLPGRGASGGPTYALIDDSKLDTLREGLEVIGNASFKIGDRVRVMRGENKNLTGFVTDVHDDGQVIVSARLRSKPLLVPYPSSYLEKIV